MTIKSAKDVLSTAELKRVVVYCPEWGCDVVVRELTATERSELEETFREKANRRAVLMRQKLISMVCINPDGTPWLENGDAEAIMKASSSAVERLFEAGLKISGMTEDVEEMGKN